MTNYFGVTYPHKSMMQLAVWKTTKCVKNMHLFDEVWSTDYWYLVCDACKLHIAIKHVDTKFVDDKVLKKIMKHEHKGRIPRKCNCILCRPGGK